MYDHHDDLLSMRDRVTERIDYEGLLGLMGERGQRALEAIETIETAVEAGDLSYVSVVASLEDTDDSRPEDALGTTDANSTGSG
jgi:hypothetical protein